MPAKQFGRLVLLRHGQTVWSESGQYTGRTDIPLTDEGERQAVRAGERLREAFPNGFLPGDIFTSTMGRAQSTAELAGFPEHETTENIVEWDYGRAEGRTRQQLAAMTGFPWDVWRDGSRAIDPRYEGRRIETLPDGQQIVVVNGPGETLDEVARRARAAIDAAMPALEAGRDVLFVAHAHILRILTTQWLDEPASFARKLRLDTAHYSVLGVYKGDHVIERWNC
ncbi:histidine phosphatase family protein [Bifidobacterium sp. BRDM6]|uniref:phosphoglycerate mutase (2,3-diphosphoglycerate-dependent) n=2 Tax=Bifidobacterium choloepi TaxID=2614131 RepID=A0A6I5NJK7_9BIFI|nr:histidine phosphatase family protein [Bifidobacterium choloepi]